MIRVQRKRVKGWRMPENTKYVGRPTKFGNPFKLSPDGYILYYKLGKIVGSPWCYWSSEGGYELKDIIELYKKWINRELLNFSLPTPPSIEELKGLNLACFCSIDSGCHVDYLIEKLK